MKNFGFIGVGNIATAIINGAVKAKVMTPNNIILFDTATEKLNQFLNMGMSAAANTKSLCEKSDVLFLTVKPQVLPDVLADLKPYFKKETLIVSPVAGIKIQKINGLLGGNKKIVRVMPNTPLMYSAGATALSRGEGVSDQEFDLVEKIFASSGVTATVDEDKLDAVTGISGSSPAFFMRFAREIINAGIQQGMTKETAEKLVVQTMLGTAKMMQESDKSVDELIKAVASPGGTTEAGLNKMDVLDFDSSVKNVITAAVDRSVELQK